MSTKVKYVLFGFLIYEGVALVYNNFVANIDGPYLPFDLGTTLATKMGVNLGGNWGS